MISSTQRRLKWVLLAVVPLTPILAGFCIALAYLFDDLSTSIACNIVGYLISKTPATAFAIWLAWRGIASTAHRRKAILYAAVFLPICIFHSILTDTISVVLRVLLDGVMSDISISEVSDYFFASLSYSYSDFIEFASLLVFLMVARAITGVAIVDVDATLERDRRITIRTLLAITFVAAVSLFIFQRAAIAQEYQLDTQSMPEQVRAVLRYSFMLQPILASFFIAVSITGIAWALQQSRWVILGTTVAATLLLLLWDALDSAILGSFPIAPQNPTLLPSTSDLLRAMFSVALCFGIFWTLCRVGLVVKFASVRDRSVNRHDRTNAQLGS